MLNSFEPLFVASFVAGDPAIHATRIDLKYLGHSLDSIAFQGQLNAETASIFLRLAASNFLDQRGGGLC